MKNNKPTNVLVTGGAGFIGSHISKKLYELGCKVRILDILLHGNKLDPALRKEILLLTEDVCDREAVNSAMEEIDVVVHLAAYLGVDAVAKNPLTSMRVEQEGLYNVLNAARRHNVKKILYSSSSSVYGSALISKAIKECNFTHQSSPYSVSKRYGEIYLRHFSLETGISACSLRLFNVYGPGQDSRMVVPRFIINSLSNSELEVYEDGLQTRDFTYIDDVVDSVVSLIGKSFQGEIFNICTGQEMAIGDLAKSIINLTQSSSRVIYTTPSVSRDGYEVKRRFGDASLLERAIGFAPKVKLKDGIRKTIDYHIKCNS
jgi:UDP-glucose 4-epimerase